QPRDRAHEQDDVAADDVEEPHRRADRVAHADPRGAADADLGLGLGRGRRRGVGAHRPSSRAGSLARTSRGTRLDIPHVTSYSVSPAATAKSAVVMRSLPCPPRSTTSSPGATPGTADTSAIAMSMLIAPRSGQRTPRTSASA